MNPEKKAFIIDERDVKKNFFFVFHNIIIATIL